MSVNSSSISSLPHPLLFSSINTFHLYDCYNSTVATYSMTAFNTISVLILLPLCLLVLYLGLQRWRRQRSNATTSHSDIFTYHMVVMEMMSVVGFTLICCAIHTKTTLMIMIGTVFIYINITGQMQFHVLTCVERYLAVVHPITYRSLKKTKWIRIRNMSIGCVWLLCLAGTNCIFVEEQKNSAIFYFFIIAFVLFVISFCSLSVLFVLIHPGLGDGGEQQVDQLKLRAFYTILAILGALLFRFGGNILFTALYLSADLRPTEKCVVWLSVVWFTLPSSLVLPLLFLQRAGKLVWKKNTESGQG